MSSRSGAAATPFFFFFFFFCCSLFVRLLLVLGRLPFEGGVLIFIWKTSEHQQQLRPGDKAMPDRRWQ